MLQETDNSSFLIPDINTFHLLKSWYHPQVRSSALVISIHFPHVIQIHFAGLVISKLDFALSNQIFTKYFISPVNIYIEHQHIRQGHSKVINMYGNIFLSFSKHNKTAEN